MIILHVLEPFASGVTTAVIAITEELSDCGHIVIHGNRNGVESAEKVKKRFPPGVRFVEWPSAGREISLRGDLRALGELLAILRPYAPGKRGKAAGGPAEAVAVHLHSSKAGFLGRLACRMLGLRAVIYTPHCGAFLRTDISPFKRRLFWLFEWIGGRLGGRVVGCGPSEGALYKKLGKNTTWVSNGVKPKKVNPPARGTAGAGSGAGGGRNLVSFAGIASAQKDPALWNAVARNRAAAVRERGFAFCWIGGGPLEGELDRKYSEVTGWKSSAATEALLEKTAVFFSASAWEGLPYGVLEAMNASCALLLRNVPGNRDLVIPGENGRLFDTEGEAAEGLLTMLEDREQLAVMGRRSREILEGGFTRERMGRAYRLIYAEAAAAAAAAGAAGTTGAGETH